MYMYAANVAGFVHRDKGLESQDNVERCFRRGVSALALCDGAGSYPFAAEGAREMSRQAARQMARGFRRYAKMPEEQLRGEMVELIDLTLSRLRRKYGCEEVENAFASTLICVGCDAKTGEYLAVHLGDGLFLAEKGERVICTATGRYGTGDRARATVLTTAPAGMLLREMQIRRGRADRVVAASDGGENRLFRREGRFNAPTPALGVLLNRLEEAPSRQRSQTLTEVLQYAFRPMDDLSVGILSRRPAGEALERPEFVRYALAREAGLGRNAAARRAGWGRRNRKRKIAQAAGRNLL